MKQNQSRPQWQPLNVLPTLGPHIDGMLESAQEQYETLQEALPKPHVLDDFTVNRVIEVYTTQKNDLWLLEEQLRRWGAEPKVSTTQRAEIVRLKKQMVTLRQVVTAILDLADELKKGTIETILNMDDAELGLKSLLGKLPGQDR